ncbi:MAG: 50S ribosomal protein L33 [Mycoplasma sp.]|nr:50S ribosomal protein L33 [Mycoplasma sp.]
MKKKVALACENCHNKNYYENKSSIGERLIKNKFCKKCGSYQVHKEEK